MTWPSASPSHAIDCLPQVSASCAFMLPVATPPNAVVYAIDPVPQATRLRCGLVLNLGCIVVITAVATCVFA